MLHHHHHIEETLLFPFFETKLGEHSMDHNVEQHHAFMDGLTDLETYLKQVQDGSATYSGKTVVAKLDSFADTLIEHLRDVCSVISPGPSTYTAPAGNSDARVE
jgi:hemerythrin-like domain-containing protein